MDLGSIFLLLALFIFVVAFIIRPLLEHKSVAVSEEEQTLSTLLARRDRVLDALQELDFDFKLGKVPEADYPISRTALLKQGAEILKMLDAYQLAYQSADQRAYQPQQQAKAADALEAAIAARREQALPQTGNGTHTPKVVQLPDDNIENLLAARRSTRKSKSAGFCSQCGHPIQASDKFCSKCGASQKP